MKLIDFIRLILKHIILLIIVPVFLVIMVIILTRNPNFKYASETTLFTGIATGSGVEMDKSFNYFMTNAAYDNLIGIIKSKKTQKEVGIRLLSQHLLLNGPDPKYISEKSYQEIIELVPNNIYAYIEKGTQERNLADSKTELKTDTLQQNDSFISYMNDKMGAASEIPSYIDPENYEKTVSNLTELMNSNDTNFVYELLHYPNPHYSIKALSDVKAQRISNSDLVQLKFETDDPGICQQTLLILTHVCIRNYREIKGNRSDEVVKYFENQAYTASDRLRVAEDRLLKFNKENKIINYYEQSKAVAVVKEDLDVAYNNMRIKLAGIQAAITRLEEKLQTQGAVQLKSEKILEKKNLLGELTYKIAMAETLGDKDDYKNLEQLRSNSEQIQEELKDDIGVLYNYNNSKEGLPLNTLLNDWLSNVVEAENLKAGLEVFQDRILEFQDQYSIYAPAGATVKRIEREISVAEREYLSILYGLNLAKLKMQDNELASIIKITDPPFYPLSPIPTKRKILVIVAAFMGFIFVLATIIALEYFDNTLKNPEKATKFIKLKNIGILPKMFLRVKKLEFPFIITRLLEIIIQNIELEIKNNNIEKTTKTILFFSTLNQEGKSVVMSNIAQQLKQKGKKVLALEYSKTTESEMILSQNRKNKTTNTKSSALQANIGSLFTRLLGYSDSRIDYNSPFLVPPKNNLNDTEFAFYDANEEFYSSKNYEEILKSNHIQMNQIPEYVLIELPPILYNSYPVNLIINSDIPVLVCRANRVWSDADKGALETLINFTKQKTYFVLNGVKLSVVETVLGDLPRKRSWLRRKLKNVIQFQFSTRTHL